MIQSNLAILMAERGLKIADLYEETGISKTTLMSLSENTGKGVQFDTIDKLCNYLGVTPKEFFDYAPYIIDLKDSTSIDNHEIPDIALTVKKQFYERTFYISTYIWDEKMSFPLPIDVDKLDFTVNVVLEESDAYDNDEFLTFLSSLSISFKTKIINEIYKKTIANLKNIIGKKIKHYEYPLNENSDLLIHLLKFTEFEMIKKVKLSEVK